MQINGGCVVGLWTDASIALLIQGKGGLYQNVS